MMTVLVLVLALIVAAASVLAVKLLRPETVSEQGLADLNQSLAGGYDYEVTEPLLKEGRSAEHGLLLRGFLTRLRGDFVTAWVVCRLLGPISQQSDPGPKLYRSWLSFHWLFAVVWIKSYLGKSSQSAGQVGLLVAIFGELRQRATVLMRLDAGMGVSGTRA